MNRKGQELALVVILAFAVSIGIGGCGDQTGGEDLSASSPGNDQSEDATPIPGYEESPDSQPLSAAAVAGCSIGCQCVAYAKSRVSCMSESGRKWNTYKEKKGNINTSSPSAGAVAIIPVFKSTWGHVAVVDTVNKDGTITISEQNWQGCCVVSSRTGTPRALKVDGYFVCSQPPLDISLFIEKVEIPSLWVGITRKGHELSLNSNNITIRGRASSSRGVGTVKMYGWGASPFGPPETGEVMAGNPNYGRWLTACQGSRNECETWEAHISPPIEGWFRIHFGLLDNAGNFLNPWGAMGTIRNSSPDYVDICVDLRPPVTMHSVSAMALTLSAREQGSGDPSKVYEGKSCYCESGVRWIDYSLDGAAWATYQGPIRGLTPGQHTVRVASVDGAWNVEQQKQLNFTVTLSLQNGTLYNRGGWIYVVVDNVLWHVPDPGTMDALHLSFSDASRVNESEWAYLRSMAGEGDLPSIQSGDYLRSTTPGDLRVFYYEAGRKRYISDPRQVDYNRVRKIPEYLLAKIPDF